LHPATLPLSERALQAGGERLPGRAHRRRGPARGDAAVDDEVVARDVARVVGREEHGGPDAARDFSRLVDACEAFAKDRGATTLVVGVAMQSGNEPGYNVPEVWAIDDGR